MTPNRIDRRSFIVGSVATSALVACGSSGPRPERLGVRFPDGIRTGFTHATSDAGPQRFPFVLIAGDSLPVIEDAPETIEIELRLVDTGEVVGTETVPRRGAGQFTPYYPLVFTPPRPGRYFATPDFGDTSVEFRVGDRSEVTLFQVGDALPPFDTPTFNNARGVTPVCTRAEPCPYHEMTLTDAVTSGRPTTLLIATPEFCQTDVCGPSVEFLIEAANGRDDMNFVHAEVYADPRNPDQGSFPKLAPLLEAWELQFEPSIFVADATGTIVAARHFAFDLDEVAEVVSRA
jgi:hypothetical protein